MENTSGIYPCGNRVLILPDEIEEVTEGGIIIAETIAEKHAMSQTTGQLVEIGPDAFIHEVTRGPDGTTVSGYTAPWAQSGDRICFAKYGGLMLSGKDGKEYRLMNDKDITAKVDPEVTFTGLQARKSLHE